MKKTYFCFILAIIFCVDILSGCSQHKERAKQEQVSAEPEKHTIPDVIGMPVEKAKQTLDQNGIKYEIEAGQYHEKYDKDVIYEQSSTGVFSGSPVILKMSLGLEYTIENFQGQKYEKVKNKLKLFKKNLAYTYSTRYKKGVVISSDFIGGTFHKGERGTVTISNGKYSKKKVKGNNVETAKKQFPGAKFKIKYKLSTARRGKVLSYSVGESNKKGSVPVNLVVSDGRAVKVPDVTNKTESDAVNILIDKGISYDIKYVYRDINSNPTISDGEVVSQSKKGKLNRNKTVKLTISKPAITISKMNLTLDYAGNANTQIYFSNTSEETISSIRFFVAYYARVGEKAYSGATDEYIGDLKYVGPLYGYQEETVMWDCVISNNATAAVKPLYADVKFMNGAKQRITFSGIFWHTSDYAGGNSLPD